MKINVHARRRITVKTLLPALLGVAALAVLSGCEDDREPATQPASSSSGGGGAQPSAWQDPSTISRSYTYEIVVLNTRNQAIPGALMTFEVEGYISARQALTNIEGGVSFLFHSPPNERANILAQSTGYRPGALSVLTGANTTQTYFMTLADF